MDGRRQVTVRATELALRSQQRTIRRAIAAAVALVGVVVASLVPTASVAIAAIVATSSALHFIGESFDREER